jgi:predicted transcriptional regulator
MTRHRLRQVLRSCDRQAPSFDVAVRRFWSQADSPRRRCDEDEIPEATVIDLRSWAKTHRASPV